jgi:Flp pilus assembly protein TadG
VDEGARSRDRRTARRTCCELLHRRSDRLVSRLRGESGQALVEFALVLPLLLIILLGILDFSRAMNYYNDLTQLAAEGARSAAVGQNPDGTGASLTSIQTQVKGQATSPEMTNNATFQVCIPAAGFPTKVGQPVKVTASMNFQLIPLIGSKLGFGALNLSSSSTMRTEQVPAYTSGCA